MIVPVNTVVQYVLRRAMVGVRGPWAVMVAVSWTIGVVLLLHVSVDGVRGEEAFRVWLDDVRVRWCLVVLGCCGCCSGLVFWAAGGMEIYVVYYDVVYERMCLVLRCVALHACSTCVSIHICSLSFEKEKLIS